QFMTQKMWGYCVRAMLSLMVIAGQGAADERFPAPTKAEQAAAEKTVDEILAVSPQSPVPDSRSTLARKMMLQRSVNRGDAAVFYVLLKDAQVTAAQSGNVRWALQTENKLAETFAISDSDVRTAELAILTDALHSSAKPDG